MRMCTEQRVDIVPTLDFQRGRSKITSLPFGFFIIKWLGSRDPAKEGYVKLFSSIYRREKNYESKKRDKEVQNKEEDEIIDWRTVGLWLEVKSESGQECNGPIVEKIGKGNIFIIHHECHDFYFCVYWVDGFNEGVRSFLVIDGIKIEFLDLNREQKYAYLSLSKRMIKELSAEQDNRRRLIVQKKADAVEKMCDIEADLKGA